MAIHAQFYAELLASTSTSTGASITITQTTQEGDLWRASPLRSILRGRPQRLRYQSDRAGKRLTFMARAVAAVSTQRLARSSVLHALPREHLADLNVRKSDPQPNAGTKRR